jgi:hypothetical protein
MRLAVLLLSIVLAAQQDPVTNSDVIKMVAAGFQESTIIRVIEGSETSLDTSVEALVAMKSRGVSDGIIRAMIAAGTKREAIPTLRTPIPDEPGVYAVRDGALEPVKAEVVGWRDWVKGGWTSGTVAGSRSSLRLQTPGAFIVRSPDQTIVDEFVLLQLFTKTNRREFRTVTGGSWRGDGPERMRVPFQSRRLRPNTYLVRVPPLPKGEYGFVPPGAFFAQSAASSDRILTFGVD